MKNLAKRALRSLGYSLSTVEYAKDYLPELHLIEIFRKTGTECVLDVGANTGQYRDFLRETVGFKGWILSFEPVPEHITILKRRAALDDRWLIHEYALGEADSEMDINVTKGGDLSSFLMPLSKNGDHAISKSVSVPVRTLDSMAESLSKICPLENIYLKLDTQGFDLRVLRGGSQVLHAIPAIQTELSFLPIYEKMPSFTEVYDFLTTLGFDLTGMFPVSRNSSMGVVEFDGIFMKRGYSEQPSSK